MKASLHLNARNKFFGQKAALDALARGLARHGIECVWSVHAAGPAPGADFAVLWSWKRRTLIQSCRERGMPVLCCENGFIEPRGAYVSLVWDGFNNLGRRPECRDDGTRFRRLFGDRLRPWREGGETALVIGHVGRDTLIYGRDMREWAAGRVEDLRRMGERVVYRPHPMDKTPVIPEGAEASDRGLQEELSRARFCLTFSSTVAVESVLHGVPTVAEHPGSLAWDVASHDMAEPLVRPDRAAWAHRLAWASWSREELESGAAWDVVRELRCSAS